MRKPNLARIIFEMLKKYPPSVLLREAWWICCEENTSQRAIVNMRLAGITGRKLDVNQT